MLFLVPLLEGEGLADVDATVRYTFSGCNSFSGTKTLDYFMIYGFITALALYD